MTPTTKAPTIRYSPRPREEYRGVVRGSAYGPATSGLLDSTQSWNLAYISFDFEKRLHHADPYFTTNVKRTTQTLILSGGLDILEETPVTDRIAGWLLLPAPRFVKLIKGCNALKNLPMYLAYGDQWLETIEERAHVCQVDDWLPDNVIDFSQAHKAIEAAMHR
jgi:hypothetical protein